MAEALGYSNTRKALADHVDEEDKGVKNLTPLEESNSQGFVENEDYTSVRESTEVRNNGGVQMRELQDYSLTVDMAKHICLMSRTEKVNRSVSISLILRKHGTHRNRFLQEH